MVVAAAILVLVVLVIYAPWKIDLGFSQQVTPDGFIRSSEESIRRYSFIWKAPEPTAGEEADWGTTKPEIDFRALEWETVPVIMLAVFLLVVFREPNALR